MLRIKRIDDLDELRAQSFPPPFALVETLEDTQERGEAWWVLMAYEEGASRAGWVVGFPESGASRFFTEGEELNGRWDGERELFLTEEGPPLDLRGHPVSLATIEEDEEEEDAEEEGRRH